MAVNSSSYSVLPIPIHTNNDYASAMRGSTPVFAPRYPSWEADDLYYPNWEDDFHLLNLEDDHYWMECEVDERFGNGAEADRYGSYDPVNMLPSDPFGMELSTSFAAAIADWAGDFGASPSEYGLGGDYLVTGWSYDFNRGSGASSELQLSFGGNFDVWEDDRFLGPSQSVEEDMEDFLSSNRAEADHSSGDDSVPHEGLLFALGHLGVKDLLSVEMVCRSLHSAVQTETLLWRCIHIDSPLSERITDDALLRITQRAQGSLQCLSLVGCSRITDDGLRHVLECNPRLKKLGVPGCVRLSINGLIKNLKALKPSGKPELKCVKLGRFFSVSPAQFEDLKLLVVSSECRQMKPRYYHSFLVSPLACDDDRSIDVEKCPMCDKYKLVYDCPSESCQGPGRGHCRACEVCIARCVHCGRCISDRKYVETFCLEYLCSDCWKHMPLQSPDRLLWDKN